MTPSSRGEATQSPVSIELELQRDVQAPALARAATAELADVLTLSRPTAQTLLLLVSEVVTNAVIHSKGAHEQPIMLAASADKEAIHVAVTDAGPGFIPRQRDPSSINDGYGLYLLEKAASRWGVESRGATTVWFELPRSG